MKRDEIRILKMENFCRFNMPVPNHPPRKVYFPASATLVQQKKYTTSTNLIQLTKEAAELNTSLLPISAQAQSKANWAK